MDNLTSVISGNLLRLRQQKSLSLDSLAKLSGVSKAMISQIERGTTNPTVNVLWKLATALHVPLGSLLAADEPLSTFVQIEDLQPISDTAGLTVYPVFSLADSRSVEIFSTLLPAQSSHVSDPHAICSVEYILPITGKFQVSIQEKTYDLSAGSVLKIDASHPHAYHNPFDLPAMFYCVLHHTRS